MTTAQLNSEVFRNMSIIAEDENLMKRMAKYLRKLVAEKDDSTLIPKGEFLDSIEKGESEYLQGKTHAISSKEELDAFLNSLK